MLYSGQSQAQGPPIDAGQPVRPQGRGRGRTEGAWRSEQSDAVMGSGPAVAGRCPRLAKERYAQTTILRKAVGHPAAFRRHVGMPEVGSVAVSDRTRRSKRR
jgi:hypothetical protein